MFRKILFLIITVTLIACSARSPIANADQPFALPRYYPYSGDYYPIIGGTHGQTFDEMLLGAIDQ